MSSYTRELVELLMPAIWDEDYAYGMRMPTQPDPEMPRTPSDPKKGGVLFAHLADIRRAWDRAILTVEQRRVLLLRYGMDWDYKDIGYNQGVSKQAAQQRAERAISRILSFLNGQPTAEELSEEDLFGLMAA